MDADLSHPPEAIPQILSSLQRPGFDCAVCSRYKKKGSIDAQWGMMRRLNSKIATLLAAPLIKISDPMSGFFGLKKDKLPPREILNPIGYKILLEIAIKANFRHIAEIPIHFINRRKGESKLSAHEKIKYIQHLRRLYQYRFPTASEFIQFCLVGTLGMVIDISIYLILFVIFSVDHQIARAISFWPAVTSNWMLNRLITFQNRKKTHPLQQWTLYLVTSTIGFSLNWGAYFVLTSQFYFFNQHKLTAFLIGILIGTGFNFIISNLFIFYDYRKEDT